jgi:hypothetical protein
LNNSKAAPFSVSALFFEVSAQPQAAGAGQFDRKKNNNSPQSPQRTPRKKILNNLCDLCVLSGEGLHKHGNGSYEVSCWVASSDPNPKRNVSTIFILILSLCKPSSHF